MVVGRSRLRLYGAYRPTPTWILAESTADLISSSLKAYVFTDWDNVSELDFWIQLQQNFLYYRMHLKWQTGGLVYLKYANAAPAVCIWWLVVTTGTTIIISSDWMIIEETVALNRIWHFAVQPRSVYPGGWGLYPLKIYMRGQSTFWPPKMSHYFIKNCGCITLQVSHRHGWDLCQKMEN